MKKFWIGVDNGCTGNIGIISSTGEHYLYHTPTHKTYNYQKEAQKITRIHTPKLKELLQPYSQDCEVSVALERPMVTPQRLKSSLSAVRSLEATLIVLEALELPYFYLDSRTWQKLLLPPNIGGPELKVHSLAVGKSLFPTIDYKGFKDADALLIAEWLKRNEKVYNYSR